MKDRNSQSNQCSIAVTGPELIELKRHARQIPECPGLDRRIQKYNGKGLLRMSRDELDWLVAVLDAVLHDPKGYPCIEYEPWKLECVSTKDDRCVTCKGLYKRLRQESERLCEIIRKKHAQRLRREQAAKAKQDPLESRIEAVFQKRGCPAIASRINRGYTILLDDRAVSRIRQQGDLWEVFWWRGRWDQIGDFRSGMVFNSIEEAAAYVLDDPMGIFWP